MYIAVGFAKCQSNHLSQHSEAVKLRDYMFRHFLKIEAPEITLQRYGKPVCRDAVFSVSHSGGIAFCALHFFETEDFPPYENGYHFEYYKVSAEVKSIGADIEEIAKGKESKCRRIASSRFSDEENEVLSQLPEEEYVKNFLALWTRKESYGKMTGRGIAELSANAAGEEFITSDREFSGKSYVFSICAK